MPLYFYYGYPLTIPDVTDSSPGLMTPAQKTKLDSLTGVGVAVSGGTSSVSSGTLLFANSNGVTFGISGSVMTATVNPGPAMGIAAVSAGTQSQTVGTLVLSNSNNVSFGMSGTSIVTASASFLQTTQPAINAAAGTQTATSGTVVWSNSNNVSFGMSGSSRITASASFPAQTTQPAIQSVSAGTTRATTGEVVWSNSNNVSFGLDGQTMTASASFNQTTQPAVVAGAGTQTATSGTVVWSNSNNVSFGMSGSSLITASASFNQTTQPAANIAAGTQTATSGTVVWSNSNGISFGMSGSSRVTASADYVRSISAGTTNATGNQIVFSNANGVSFGVTGATITATVTPGPSAGIAAIGAGTQTATSGTIVFGDSNGVTFGMSGSQVTASVNVSPTVKAYSWPSQPAGSFGSSNAALSLVKFDIPYYQSATRMLLLGHMNVAGVASTSSGGLSLSVGIYSMSGSIASLASSASRFISWVSNSATGTGTVSNDFANNSGTQYRSVALGTWNLAPGDYLMGFWARTANAGSWTWWGNTQTASLLTGQNADSGNSSYFMHGFSASSFTTAMPSSINVTSPDYVRTGESAMRQPGFLLQGSF